MNPSNQKTSELRQKVINFIATWHSGFILDYWWRKKYNIPFNSKNHRSISPQDMLLDFIEDGLYRKFVLEKEESPKYVPGEKDFLIPRQVTEEDFDSVNLDDFKF